MSRLLPFLVVIVLVINSEARPKKLGTQKLTTQAEEIGERLPNTTTPSEYTLHLTLTEDSLENNNFTGVIEVKFQVNQDDLKSFPIHAKYLTIDKSNGVVLKKGEEKIKVCHYGPDSRNDFLTIEANNPLTTGAYVLTISYTGKLSETDMEGFYKSTYIDADGKRKALATTHFEEMGARRAFPCFDEPHLKAKWTTKITHPSSFNAISNTEGTVVQNEDGTNTTTFAQTPEMSSYLVAFIVSEFTFRDGSDDNIPIKLFARVGTEDTMSVGLETAPKALEQMANFTGINYKDLGIDKLYLAAIPDFPIGAMENWGLITFREAVLLWDEDQSSNYYKQTVVKDVTHEISHQWFGNYVTLDWWSDIFLNEGFATYFEYYAAHEIQKDWELTKQFVLEELQPALVTDSTGESLPLSYDTTDPDLIKNRFDDISYNKGGSILRMLQHFIGEDAFKKGLNTYLTTYANSTCTPEKLWESFKESLDTLPATVVEIMDNWTTKHGYPLITAKLSDDNVTITLSQESFLLTGFEDTTWYVPITYTVNNKNFENTTTKLWLIPDNEATIALNEETDWIILNNQQIGYYRVNYDDNLLNKISNALSDNLTQIDEISRSHIIDDQLNLARGGRKNFSDVLNFLKFLEKDDSYYSWSSAFNGFNYLLSHVNDNSIKQALKNYILQSMDALLKSVPIDKENSNKQIYTIKQVLALQWACTLGDNNCINEAKTRFTNYRDKNIIPSANLKSIVYCNGLRESEHSRQDYDFLYEKYYTSSLATERVTILKALGCTNNQEKRNEYLQKSLTEEIKIQDQSYVFQSVYLNNPEGIDDVLSFLRYNYTNFDKHFGSSSVLISLINDIADQITTQNQLDTLDDIIEELNDTIQSAVKGASQRALDNLQVVKAVETNLKDYFQLSSASINNNHCINLILVFTGLIFRKLLL